MSARILLTIFLMLGLISCVKEEKKEDKPANELIVAVAGSSNLGKVPIGESRHTGIIIINRTSSDVSYTVSGVVSPLMLNGVSSGCTFGTVRSGQECTIKLIFSPVSTLERVVNVSILGKTLTFRGRGLREGELSISPNVWNAGSFEAGVQQTRTFSVSNIGDTSLPIPNIANPDYRIISHSCGDSIEPQETCTVAVSVNKVFAEEINEDVNFYLPGNPVLTPFNFIGSVRPTLPAGIIEFEAGQTQIVANGESKVIVTSKAIRDPFGNVVSDGIFVAGTGQNLVLDANGKYTSNGIVSFEVTSTEIVGASKLYVSSNTASGVYNISTVSGPPVGTITAQAYNPNVRANGYSTLTITTNQLVSALGNIVSDGEPLEAVLTGPGVIETPVISTVNGVAMVKIRADFTAGNSQLTLRANPVRDAYGDIVEYLATGTFNINFIPVEAIGNFNIASSHPSVYSGIGEEFNKTVTITVSEAKDIYGNLVGAGVSANVSIINGFNSANNLKTFSIVTDVDSGFSFTVSPDSGIRDFVEVEVEIGGQVNSIRVFAMDENVKRHNRGSTNEINLFISRDSSDFSNSMLPPTSNKWTQFTSDYYAIRSQDSSNFALKKSFGEWRLVSSPQRHMIWDCILPVDNYVMISPCEVKKANGETYTYSAMSILESVIERSAEIYVNANVPALPNHNSAFGGHAVGVTPIFNKSDNSFYLLGGVIPEEVDVPVSGGGWVTRYRFSETNKDIKYADATLLSYSPVSGASFDDDLYTPWFSSSYTYKDKTFFFGGLRLLPFSGGSREIEGGDRLQIFQNGNLQTITVASGVNGTPAKRYQNGVYYDHNNNSVYIISGVNTNDVFLDDIWRVDLSDATPTWTRICNPCGLPDLTTKRALQIAQAYSTPITLDNWMNIAESVQPIKVFKDKNMSNVFISKNNSPILKELNLSTGYASDVTDEEFLDFRNFGQLLHHHDIDRFYKHTIIQSGTTDTRLYHLDGRKGEMAYYMAEILFDEYSALYAKSLRPIVSAYSENKTFITTTPVTTYGVEVLMFNFTTNSWDMVGSSSATSPNFLTSESYNVTGNFLNTSDYFGPGHKVYLLIKPKDAIGRTSGSSVKRRGENTLMINMIKVEGVF